MQRILSKRVLRDIRENLLRYLALFFLVALVMYMVVAIVGAAETIMQGTKESGRVHHREDGQFGVFVPLTEKETAQITEKGVTLQMDFSLDFHLGQSTFRVYQARESVDLFVPAEGEEIPAQGEILLEQHYAEKHELQLGDIFIVGGKEFTVAGIGSTPDYDAAFEKTSDTTVDSNLFGFGFVTAEDYEALKAGGQNFRTEDYIYTYLLNDTMTDQELKELLQSFELDRSKVTDTYFLEMLADAEETKNDIQDGIQELLDGVDELVDGVDELADHNTELTDAADELFDAMLEQVNDSLKDAGVEVTLTSGNYEQQLNAMIANPHAYTASLRQNLQDAKKSLEDLQEFRDGVKSYTDGVNAASAGGGALVGGMSQITENSAALNQGADAIFNAILGMVNEQLQAILYRMNAQSAPIESYFTRAGIPHKIVGGQRFNDRKEVKDIHSYMSIVANPRDDVRLRRIINEPARKIGATTIEVIADLAAQQGISMLDVISHADQYAKLSRAIAPLFKFWDIYQKLQESLETKTLDEFASDVIEITGYRAMLEADAAKGHEDAADRLQNLGQLVNNVKSYCDQHGEEASLEGYLEDIALISDIDSYNESADQVVLMTIHSAKGLEFPYVFLIGMEEGVFPSEMSKYSEADLEEERRLAYVGITRAKKELYISNSVTRMLYGRTQRNEPSRFLREIEPEYIEETRSPVLEQRSRLGGWGSSYSDTVPGGASGYSGPSGWGRSAGGYGSGGYGSRSGGGYLNREYNAGERSGFGSGYAGRGTSSSGYGAAYGNSSTQPKVRSGGFGAGYSGTGAKTPAAKISFTGAPAVKAAPAGSKHYEPGDVVEHKVFGRGRVLAVKAAAGDQIVEINFEKVGVKKTMANFAPLTKITEE